MSKPRVMICTSDIYSGDAIGNFSIQLRNLLEDNGFDAFLFARYYNAIDTPYIIPLDLLPDHVKNDDIIFVQYSIFERFNEYYQSFSNKKIIYYHGITPFHYFSGIDSQTEENCKKGIEQAKLFASFDYYLANSNFMLDELMLNVFDDNGLPRPKCCTNTVAPIINLSSRLASHEVTNEPIHEDYFLYVGRLAPHKKIDTLIDWFAEFNKLSPSINLKVVGSDAPFSYAESIRSRVLGSPSICDKVQFLGHVKDSELYNLYKNARAFITFSEHEGFCVPLVEAMGFDIPIFARGAAAIPETLARSEGLFSGTNVKDYASQVYDLLKDNDRIEMLVEEQRLVYERLVEQSKGDKIISIVRQFVPNS